jgi:hypothetical protein
MGGRAEWTDHWRNERQRDQIMLPSDHWEWEGEWEVVINLSVDEEGWEYASGTGGGDFASLESGNGVAAKEATSFVRRRQWARVRSPSRMYQQDAGVLADEDGAGELEDGERFPSVCHFRPRDGLLFVQSRGSQWSYDQPIDVSKVGLSTVIELKGRQLASGQGNKGHGSGASEVGLVELAVTVSPAPGKFYRSKVVTFTSRFTVVCSQCVGRLLFLQQLGSERRHALSPGTQVPFHWSDASTPHLVHLGVLLGEGSAGGGTEYGHRRKRSAVDTEDPPPSDTFDSDFCWSGAFALDILGDMAVLIRSARKDTVEMVVRVETKLGSEGANGGVIVLLRRESSRYPLYSLRNFSSLPVFYKQCHGGKDTDGEDGAEEKGRRRKGKELPPLCVDAGARGNKREMVPMEAIFGWDAPQDTMGHGRGKGAAERIQMLLDFDAEPSAGLRELELSLSRHAKVGSTVEGKMMQKSNKQVFKVDEVGATCTLELRDVSKKETLTQRVHARVVADGYTKVVELRDDGYQTTKHMFPILGGKVQEIRQTMRTANRSLREIAGLRNTPSPQHQPDRRQPQAQQNQQQPQLRWREQQLPQESDSPVPTPEKSPSSPGEQPSDGHRGNEQTSAVQAAHEQQWSLDLDFTLPSVAVSVIDWKPQELILLTINGMHGRFVSEPLRERAGGERMYQPQPELLGSPVSEAGFVSPLPPEKANGRAEAGETSAGGIACTTKHEINLSMQHVQIDNMDRGTIYPVVLAPSPIAVGDRIDRKDGDPHHSASNPHDNEPLSPGPGPSLAQRATSSGSGEHEDNDDPPFLSLILHKSEHAEKEYTHIKVFDLLLQAVDLAVDEELVRKLLVFIHRVQLLTLTHDPAGADSADNGEAAAVAAKAGSADEQAVCQLAGTQPPHPIASAASTTPAPRIYFELLQIHPIKLNITFARIPKAANEVYVGVNPLRLLIDAMQHLDSAQLKMNKFRVEHPLETAATLTQVLTNHYAHQVKSQWYELVGSLQVLGDPAGLIHNMGNAVHSLYYEPVKGYSKAGVAGVAAGVGRGVTGAVQHSAYGVFNTASALTTTFAKGLAHATLDKEYIHQQRVAMFHNDDQRREELRATHTQAKAAGPGKGTISGVIDRVDTTGSIFKKGVKQGLSDIGQGFADGVAGLVNAPIAGAKEQGVYGAVRGLGLGTLGVVVKPLVGMAEGTTRVLEGVRDMTTAGGGDSAGQRIQFRSRVRLPRAFYGADRRLKVYNQDAAVVAGLLFSADYLHKLDEADEARAKEMQLGSAAYRRITSSGSVGGAGSGSGAGKAARRQARRVKTRREGSGRKFMTEYEQHLDLGRQLLVLTSDALLIFDKHAELNVHTAGAGDERGPFGVDAAASISYECLFSVEWGRILSLQGTPQGVMVTFELAAIPYSSTSGNMLIEMPRSQQYSQVKCLDGTYKTFGQEPIEKLHTKLEKYRQRHVVFR